MASTTDMTPSPEEWTLSEIRRIESIAPRPPMPLKVEKSGLLGRMFGRSSSDGGSERRLLMEGDPAIEARVAVLVSYNLLHASHRDVVQLLPEALYDGALPDDLEERFMLLAEAARTIVSAHLEQQILGVPSDQLSSIRLRAVIDALDDESQDTLAESLRRHLQNGLTQRDLDIELTKEDALLIEINNVVLGDVDDDGVMPYSMDVLVDGHPFATIASPGDGSIEVVRWHGEHGPDDLEALKDYVALCGEPRSDEHGDRPDSLEEVLLDKVTALLTRYTFIQAMSDSVLFCDRDAEAPGGYVIKVAPIDPEFGREVSWGLVLEEFPGAILLDLLDENDGFLLWAEYSTV